MRANVRVPAPRGAAAHCDPGGQLRCDRQAEDMLKVFFPDAADGQVLPADLRGLVDGAQLGTPGIRPIIARSGVVSDPLIKIEELDVLHREVFQVAVYTSRVSH